MFESCYIPDYGAVGIVGPSAEIISSLQFHESYSIILIDYASMAVTKNSLDYPAFRNKLQTFLISTSSWADLHKILLKFKTSQWRNHMASFLIIDNSTSRTDQGCLKALNILRIAWMENLLNAKFICLHESEGPLIYSYNPFIDQAPIPWQVEGIFRSYNVHRWTLLVRSYQDSPEICEDLDFDQTKNLNGYAIQTGVLNGAVNETLESETYFIRNTERSMFRALNSTNKIVDIHREQYDIILNAVVIDSFEKLSMTYPHSRFELAFITQHRNLSQIEKLLHVIDQSSRYAVVIVCTITFVFFKFFLRQSITSAMLNIVRLICNAAVPNLSNEVATRIYLSGLFIFVMTMQGIYQGKWASLLTKPVALSKVETFEDLENLNYTIYASNLLTGHLEKWNYRGRVVPLDDFNCAQYVLQDDSAACLSLSHHLIDIAKKYNFHLSDTVIQLLIAYLIREDWPLEKRWNILISRLVESNIVESIVTNKFNSISRLLKLYEKEKENQGPTVIALKDLTFAFAILGIGLGGATVVFFVEVWKGRKWLIKIKNRGSDRS